MWIRMARLFQSLENVTATNSKYRSLSSGLRAFDESDYVNFSRIICQEYGSTNIGEARATKWLAAIFEVHEKEIIDATLAWGDLGEGIYQFLSDGEYEDSTLSLSQVLNLLDADCSSIKSDAFLLYKEALTSMSALEIKWFVRYWLNKPRSGVSTSTLKRAFAITPNVGKEAINAALKHRSVTELIGYYAAHGDEFLERLPEINWIGRFITPMLAKKYNGRNLPRDFVVDIKYDGNRYQIHNNANTTIMFNRKGKQVNDQFPDILEMFSDINHEFIIDCEIYPIREDGSPDDHKKMGKRVHSKDKEKAVEECPVRLVVFDIMYYNGTLLTEMSYEERLMYFDDCPDVVQRHRAEFLGNDVESSYQIAISEGFEGIMIKDLETPYESKRSAGLLKHKPPRIELDVVIMAAKYGRGKRGDVFGTYEIGAVSGAGFSSLGWVGGGLSEGDLLHLTTTLKRIVEYYDNERQTFHFLPRIVLEITADLVSYDDDGNLGLRFPRVTRIREDKFPADCNTIEDVVEMM